MDFIYCTVLMVLKLLWIHLFVGAHVNVDLPWADLSSVSKFTYTSPNLCITYIITCLSRVKVLGKMPEPVHK